MSCPGKDVCPVCKFLAMDIDELRLHASAESDRACHAQGKLDQLQRDFRELYKYWLADERVPNGLSEKWSKLSGFTEKEQERIGQGDPSFFEDEE